MIRPGHHRPLGTTTTMRFEQWTGERLPALGDIAFQISAEGADDAGHVRRAYRVVGILEGRDRAHFKLVMERIDFAEACKIMHDDDGRAPWWFEFFNVPRSKR
jgi:hypothetical protein